MPLVTSDLTNDRGFSKLSPKAAVLFVLVLTRLNAHGKMEGDKYTIKGQCCRYLDYIEVEEIPGLLQECSRSTSLKYWTDSTGDAWIHSLKFRDYNRNIRVDRLGPDKLPSYPGEQNDDSSGTAPGPLPDPSRLEGGRKKEEGRREKDEDKDKIKDPPIGPPRGAKPTPVLNSPPGLPEVTAFVETLGTDGRASDYAQRFLDYYASVGWRQKGGLPITDWRAACRRSVRMYSESRSDRAPPAGVDERRMEQVKKLTFVKG